MKNFIMLSLKLVNVYAVLSNEDCNIALVFERKEITDIQKDAVEKFTSCEKVVNEAKNDVEKYVIKNGLKDMGMDSVDNIFKYVIPKTISVPKAKKRVVAIMCNFKFDMEHGMAIVFEDEKIKKIGPQDIVL